MCDVICACLHVYFAHLLFKIVGVAIMYVYIYMHSNLQIL